MSNVFIEVDADLVLEELSLKELVEYLLDSHSLDEIFYYIDEDDIKDYVGGLT